MLAELAGAGSYMISIGHLVSTTFDEKRFERACVTLLERHEVLRSHFEIRGRTINAVVSEKPVLTFQKTRMQDQAFETFRDWAVPLVFQAVDPCVAGSLIRFYVADYGDAWRFTIAGHHAVTDGFSRGVMNRELLKLYQGETLSPVQSYYQVEQAAWPERDVDVSRLVDELPMPGRIFADGDDPRTAALAGTYLEQKFPHLSRSIKSLAKETGATRFNVLAASYALALKGLTGETKLSSFFQSEGRKVLGAGNGIVGPFSNTLPLELSFDPEQSFSSLAILLGERLRATLAVESGPVMETVIAADKAPTVSLNMFPPAPRLTIEGGEVGPREFLDRRTEYDLNLVWSEDKGVLSAKAFFNPLQMSTDRVRVFLRQQERLIQAAIEAPDATCSEIIRGGRIDPIAPHFLPAESPEPSRRLHEIPFELADQMPDATAIITSKSRLTYRQLVDEAKAYAAGLIKAGIDDQDRVAILAQRGPELVAAMLGVSAAGASFAVIDASYPNDRVISLINVLQAKFAIRAGIGVPDYAEACVTWVEPETGAVRSDYKTGAPRDIAYHLFTSGTTGQPKLVSHPEKTLQRFISWQAGTLDLETPTTLMLAGLSHDPIMRDIFLPLMTGGSVTIPNTEEMGQPALLRQLLDRADVNVLHITPAAGRLLTIGQDEWRPLRLSSVFWGGARLSNHAVEAWRTLAPKARQFNLYGATETPQAALIHEISAAPERPNIPIGSALPWTRVEILDEYSKPVGVGEIGEIVIGLADPVLGARANAETASSEARDSHRTGDLGYIGADNLVRFVARRDDQLKINGYRIEPREIEAVAEAVAGVSQACLLRPEASDTGLTLYVADQSHGVRPAEVTAQLKRKLPSYMMPAQIVVIDALPLTPNGKLDRRKLALTRDATDTDAEADTGTQTPTTGNEQRLARILAKYTGQSSPLRSQSFADLGADSLSMLETRFALEEDGYDLPDDWEFLPISALVAFKAEREESGTWTTTLLRLNRLDSFIVLRCLAIVMIVVHHAEFMYVPHGASVLLFTLTGFAIGRMQMPAILKDGKTGRIWAMLARLLAPLAVVSIVLYLQNSLRGNNPHLAVLLPFENLATFIDETLLQRETTERREVWLWFLHVYLQMFLVIGGLLSIPKICNWLRRDVWRSALTFYLLSNAALAMTMLAALTWSSSFADAAHQLAHFPTTIMPFLAIGIVFAVAKTNQHKHLAIAAAFLQFGAFQLYGLHTEFLWVLALLICIYSPLFSLPRVASVVIASLSTQALMIYLTHKTVLLGIVFVSGALIPAPVHVLIALTIGIALGRLVRPVLQAVGVNRLAERQIMFGR